MTTLSYYAIINYKLKKGRSTMKPSIQEQIDHYTKQVAIYILYEYTDEQTLKFMIERLKKLVNESKALEYKYHDFTYMVSITNELNNEINANIKRYNHLFNYGLLTRSEAQFSYLNFLTLKFSHSIAFNIYTNTTASFI